MNTATLRGKDVPCVATHQRSFTTFFSRIAADEDTTFKATTWLVYAPVIIKAVEKGRTQ